MFEQKCLNLGYVRLLNIAGPVRRSDKTFDGDCIDPALTARTSFSNFDKQKTRDQDIKLVKYLIEHEHTTPLEMIETWWEMKIPLFVAAQLIRHRTASVNQESFRYIEANEEFWYPNPNEIGHRPSDMKQGRVVDETTSTVHLRWLQAIKALDTQAYHLYHNAINEGIPPEVARTRLPTATYTKWVFKQDLHNLLHLLRLRLDTHAQYETRQVAKSMFDLLLVHLPEIMTIFKETL